MNAKRNATIEYFITLIMTVMVSFAISRLISNFVVMGTTIVSGSMEPFIMTNECVFVNRLAYINNDIKRGDVVFFKDGDILEDKDAIFVKRVIGLPGDKISFEGGHVFVNDEVLDEDYIASDIATNCEKVFYVPDDQYFVLGDNREISKDSRLFKYPFIERSQIIGKYLLRLDFWRKTEG